MAIEKCSFHKLSGENRQKKHPEIEHSTWKHATKESTMLFSNTLSC